MKKVLLSVNPKWVAKICNKVGEREGKPIYEKRVEIRKNKPKHETPFKVLIYETKGRTETPFVDEEGHHIFKGRGQVIGEFVCDKIIEIKPFGFDDIRDFEKQTCLSSAEIVRYLNGFYGYGWHISDLVIYDKPRELSEFYAEGDCDCLNCKKCPWFDCGNGHNVEDDCNLAYKGLALGKSLKPILRPPQSWCYVESEGEG